MPWKPARMLRFLKKHGFVEISRYTRKGKELKKGIQEGILKQAGLVEEARSE